ncbi:MAG: glycosyltransferase family 2 protein [Clostridium sp.]|nr:glycosyltransferase family 2 protein [Clostridium sp.]
MTIYNCESTICEAVDSILNQTYKDFCIVICDDGSTDSTLDIVNKNYSNLTNVYILNNDKNLGRAISSNKCIDLICSKYIARMDGDDISLPRRLELEVNFLENNSDYAFVSCPMIYFDQNGDYKKGTVIEKPTKEDFKHETPFCHGPSMIRTEVLNSIGGYNEDKNVERVEDADLWYRLYLYGFKGYNIIEFLYKMRNDKKTFKRRKAKFRINQFLHGYRMRKKMEVRNALLHSLPQLFKVLIPWQLLYLTRRIR